MHLVVLDISMKLSILIPVGANLLYTFQCETPCIKLEFTQRYTRLVISKG